MYKVCFFWIHIRIHVFWQKEKIELGDLLDHEWTRCVLTNSLCKHETNIYNHFSDCLNIQHKDKFCHLVQTKLTKTRTHIDTRSRARAHTRAPIFATFVSISVISWFSNNTCQSSRQLTYRRYYKEKINIKVGWICTIFRCSAVTV